jgi:hypothetical protein
MISCVSFKLGPNCFQAFARGPPRTVCVSSVYFKGHRAKSLTGLHRACCGPAA